MHNNTDWRQQSAMSSNQSKGRGWAFDEIEEPKSLRVHFLIAVAAVVLVGFCLIASVS